MKKYTQYILVLAAILTFVPSTASAATVYLETVKNSISVGDTAIVTVKINADAATINTVEGNISLKSAANNAVVQEFSLANSAFGLWPRTPSLSADGKLVSFVGGVPGGFSIEGATVFKIIVEAKAAGQVTITPEALTAFANDGKGTSIPVQGKGITLNITPKQGGAQPNNEWQTVVASDRVPPEDFIIVLGQDKTLFEGKKFAFFSALDNQSGIDFYDVSENGAPAVRSGSTYVLQNQTDDVKLDVVAHDKAGNKKSSSYSGSGDEGIAWPAIIVIVLVIAIVWFLYKKWKRSKINASPAL